MSIMHGGVMRSDWATPDLSRAIFPRRNGNVGTRLILKSPYTFDNSVTKTYRLFIEVASKEFSAVRPIFINMDTTLSYTVAACNARAAANFTDAVVAPVAVTIPGGGVIATAPAAERGRYVLGDWVDLQSLPRNDGTSTNGAIVVFDAYISTASNIPSNGSNIDLTYHVSRSGRKCIARYNDGDCVTTPANFVSTTNRGHCPIVGVQYASHSRIVNVMISGDSISNGNNDVAGIGFTLPAVEAASAAVKDKTFETMLCGRGGVQSDVFSLFLDDMVSYGLIPDVLVQPIGSPTDLGNITINETKIAKGRRSVSYTLRKCAENDIAPIFWTILPCENPPKDWGASDSLRVAYNIEALSYTAPAKVLDFASPFSGSVDVSGQGLPFPGETFDGVHPTSAGFARFWPVLANALLDVV